MYKKNADVCNGTLCYHSSNHACLYVSKRSPYNNTRICSPAFLQLGSTPAVPAIQSLTACCKLGPINQDSSASSPCIGSCRNIPLSNNTSETYMHMFMRTLNLLWHKHMQENINGIPTSSPTDTCVCQYSCSRQYVVADHGMNMHRVFFVRPCCT